MVNNRVITNKLDRLERSLKRKLETFYNSKIKGSPIPADILKNQYEGQLKNIIRNAVQESYLHGNDVVGDEIQNENPDFQLFISNTDVRNITDITDDTSERFWNTAQKLQDRENAFAQIGDQVVPKPALNTAAAMGRLAVATIFISFNNSIKSKTPAAIQGNNLAVRGTLPKPTQLKPQPVIQPFQTYIPPNANVNQPQKTLEELQKTLPPNMRVQKVPPLKGKIMFVTKRDSKVDPDICRPLDGTIWEVDDPSIVTPIIDTHDWCRCKLIPLVQKDQFEISIDIGFNIERLPDE